MRRFGDGCLDVEVFVKCEYDGFAPAIVPNIFIIRSLKLSPSRFKARDNQSLAGRFQQQRIGSVNQLRMIAHILVELRGSIQLFLKEPLVNRANGIFWDRQIRWRQCASRT